MATTLRRKSTIVRSIRVARLALVRTGLRALDPVAPAMAARWATRIWCTPPQPRRSSLKSIAQPEVPAAARFTVPLPGSGSPLVAEVWGEGPIVYLQHGWGGWRGQLTALVPPLVAAGHRVVALDAPGHGESGPGPLGGRRSTMLEIADGLAAVVAVAGPAHAVIAHSGGAGAAALAVRDGLAAGRLVFIGPVADPWPYLDPYLRVVGAGPRTRPRVMHRVERLVQRDAADFDVPAWAGQLGPGELPPLLVIHDRGDREVKYADGQAIAAAWPSATLHTTDGLGHRRILTDPAVLRATVEFVTAPASASASAPVRITAGSSGHS